MSPGLLILYYVLGATMGAIALVCEDSGAKWAGTYWAVLGNLWVATALATQIAWISP